MVLSVGVLFRAIAKQTTTKRKELPWMCHCVRFSTHAFFHGKHMPPTPLSATRPDADWHSRPQICLSCLSTQCRAGPTHLQPLVFRHRLRHVVLPDHLDLESIVQLLKSNGLLLPLSCRELRHQIFLQHYRLNLRGVREYYLILMEYFLKVTALNTVTIFEWIFIYFIGDEWDWE